MEYFSRNSGRNDRTRDANDPVETAFPSGWQVNGQTALAEAGTMTPPSLFSSGRVVLYGVPRMYLVES